MRNKYFIKSTTIGNNLKVDITKEKFNELKLSKNILSEVLRKENSYDIILMNYYEFEKELFEINLKDEIFNIFGYEYINNVMSRIAQRLLNLLASITFYLDSYNDDRSKYSKYIKDEITSVHEYIKYETSNNLIYKIMKHIRNHLQHNQLSIDGITLNHENLNEVLRERTINFIIKKDNINSNYYNADNFSELPNNLDLKYYIREYVDFISNIHKTFREIFANKTNKSRLLIENIFQEHHSYKYLSAMKYLDNNLEEEIHLFLFNDDVRLKLKNKNNVPTYFKRHSINTK